jgi:hypothetical protein
LSFTGLLALVVAFVGPAPALARAESGVATNAGPADCLPVERCESWTSKYGSSQGFENSGNISFDSANPVAVTPDGRVVVEVGVSVVPLPGSVYGQRDLVSVAHDADTGKQLWTARFEGWGEPVLADPTSVVAGGSAVYVTGSAQPLPKMPGPRLSFTIAYDVLTGEELWQALYPGLENAVASGSAIAPDGSRLFVAGRRVINAAKDPWYAVMVAYDTATGDVVWNEAFKDAPADRYMSGWRVDATADRVAFLGAWVGWDGYTTDILVATWDASGSDEGTLISKVLVPSPGGLPAGIVLAAGGTRAFVTQNADPKTNCPLDECGPDELVEDLQRPTDPNRPNYVVESAGTETLAIDTTTGAVLWRSRFKSLTPETPSYSRPWHQQPIDATADGRSVFVAVTAHDVVDSGGRLALIAYDGETGVRRWVTPFGYANQQYLAGPSVSVDPAGGGVVVAGMAYMHLAPAPYRGWVAAYDSTGHQEWFRVQPAAGGWNGIVHSPDGKRVFVAGWAKNDSNKSDDDMALAAYDTGVITTPRPERNLP